MYFSLSLSDDLPRKRPQNIFKPPSADVIAYLDFSVSTTGMLTGVKVNNLGSGFTTDETIEDEIFFSAARVILVIRFFLRSPMLP